MLLDNKHHQLQNIIDKHIVVNVNFPFVFLISSHICQFFLFYHFASCESSDWERRWETYPHSLQMSSSSFDPPMHLIFGLSQQGLKLRVGFSGQFPISAFHGRTASAAFRHASLNTWNSFTLSLLVKSESGFLGGNVEPLTLFFSTFLIWRVDTNSGQMQCFRGLCRVKKSRSAQ